jgi:hypothetical protein
LFLIFLTIYIFLAFNKTNFPTNEEFEDQDKEFEDQDKLDKEQELLQVNQNLLAQNAREREDLEEQIEAQKKIASRIRGGQARTRVENLKKERNKLENDNLKLEEEIKAQKILASRVRGVQARTSVERMKQDRDKANQFNRSKHISPRATGVSDSVDKFEANLLSKSNKNDDISPPIIEDIPSTTSIKPTTSSRSRPVTTNGYQPTIDTIMDRYKQEALSVGDSVMARYRTGPEWYGATITAVLPGSLSIFLSIYMFI